MSDSPSISSALRGTADRLTGAQAEQIAAEHFGLESRATLLTGERDQNFLLQTADARFVLKVSHPDEDRGAVDFHTAALLHIAQADPGVASGDGMKRGGGQPGWAREVWGMAAGGE